MPTSGINKNGMRKKLVIVTAVVAAALGAAIILLIRRDASETTLNKPITQLVRELGPPNFLAKQAEIHTRRVKTLKIQVPTIDPYTVTNWSSVADVTAIWANSEPCQRNARYFYDEMKNDNSFDGGGWYSSRAAG